MNQQLFYLTNERLTAYAWSRKALTLAATFANDDDGWQAFSMYLMRSGVAPVTLLVDLVEEDFQHDTLPHVRGAARQALIQRRLISLYRDTPYRYAQFQARETTGRKDDQMLFSALTNIEILKPWMDLITQRRVPLAGIFSLALLGSLLSKRIGLQDDHALIVTHQSGGLRQNYFHQGRFRFSRMTPLIDDAPDAVAALMSQEVAKTRQFLASTRLVGRDAPLAVITVAHQHYQAAFDREFSSMTSSLHRFIDLQEMARLLSVPSTDAIYCEQLFLALLASRRLPSHYPTFDAGRLFQFKRVRHALNILGVLIVMGGIAWAANNLMDGFTIRSDSEQLTLETRAAEARYQAIIASLPLSADKPHEMSLAVAADEVIRRNAPDPRVLAASISYALDNSPQIRIDQLRWEVSTASSADAAQTGVAESTPSATLLGVPTPPLQTVVLEGQVIPFGQNYRSAMDSVNRFVDQLRKTPRLKVDITQAPIDVSVTTRLEGKVGSDDPDAKAAFALKLVWTPTP